MLDANYPRGERRVRIIAARNDLIEVVNRARTHYSELRGGRVGTSDRPALYRFFR
jgi:hypothetical protein